jgi:hypothetical protein
MTDDALGFARVAVVERAGMGLVFQATNVILTPKVTML